MRRILLLTMLAFATAASPILQAAPVARAPRQASPLLSHYYDGASRQKVAESDRGALNEEELLLFLLVNGDMRPALFDDYMNETDPLRRTELAKELQTRINDYYYHLAFADMDQGPELTEFEQKKVQAMLCPAVEFVWLDRVIRPQIDVTPGELRLYYRNHPEEFVTPHLVHVRYIFRRLDPTLTRDEIDAEEKLMDSLREVLTSNPDRFAEAARQYSQAQSASNGGEVPPFAEGEFFPAFERLAFNLSLPGEISSILRNDEGLFLIQLIDHILPTAVPFEEAQDRVRKSALKQEMTHMARYRIDRLRESAKIESRFNLWNDLQDGDMVGRIGEYSITKSDFWKLNPTVIDTMGNLSMPELQYHSKRFMECELMRQDLAAKGLGDDPRLARSQELAEKIVKAQRVEKRHLQEKLTTAMAGDKPAPRNAEAMFQGASRMRLFRIEGEIVDPKKLDATTLVTSREMLPGILQTYIARAMSAAPPEPEPMDRMGKVPAVVRGVTGIEDARYKFYWKDLGWIDPLSSPEMLEQVAGVGEGQFAPVRLKENGAESLYVAAERKLSAEEREQLEMRARRSSAEHEREAAIAMFRDGVAQTQDVTYTF